jgi:zinc and cadmium transporter
MQQTLLNAILATFVISLLSLAGVITFVVKKEILNKISLLLVAFSAGALLGGAFFHLLPESLEISNGLRPFIYLVSGIILFFILERFLKWHHCHESGECEVHTFTYMSLFGDGIHNFIDGMVIVSAFAVSFDLGLVTTIAVSAHELPQEFGDFGVLIHGGFSRAKALFWNFASSVTAVLGAVVGYLMIDSFENIASFLLPFAAGGFIYIAMSDLVPELHKEARLSKSVVSFVFFVFGVAFMLFIKMYFGE